LSLGRLRSHRGKSGGQRAHRHPAALGEWLAPIRIIRVHSRLLWRVFAVSGGSGARASGAWLSDPVGWPSGGGAAPDRGLRPRLYSVAASRRGQHCTV